MEGEPFHKEVEEMEKGPKNLSEYITEQVYNGPFMAKMTEIKKKNPGAEFEIEGALRALKKALENIEKEAPSFIEDKE